MLSVLLLVVLTVGGMSSTPVGGQADSSAQFNLQQLIDHLECRIEGPFKRPVKCGGEVRIPPGIYRLRETIRLRRGTRLIGASRESTRLLSTHDGSVLEYDDSGDYVADEIVIQNLTISQDVKVPATSGAAIDVGPGSARVQAVSLEVRNVNIEGTYSGILLGAAVASSIQNVTIARTVSHGVHVWYDPKRSANATQSTSTTFQAVYSYFGGGDGFRFESSAYVSCVTCASDSNRGFGYSLIGTTNVMLLSCGAEGNTLGGVRLSKAQASVISADVVNAKSGVRHGIVVENSDDTTLLGGWYSALDDVSGYAVYVPSGEPPLVIGTTFLGRYSQSRSNTNVMPVISGSHFALPAARSLVPSGETALALATGQRLDLGGGDRDYLYSDGEAVRTPAGIKADGTVVGGALQLKATELPECNSNREGLQVRPLDSGMTTKRRTRLCLCMSDGGRPPRHAWHNMISRDVGDERECP